MAITSGVSMNGTGSLAIGASPWSARRWFTIAAHALDAGDHTSGFGPFEDSSGHPFASSVAAPPDALLYGRTNSHLDPILASFDSLNDEARSWNSAIFSDETATSMTSQSPGSP